MLPGQKLETYRASNVNGSLSSSRGISVALSEVKAFADLGEGLNEEKVVVGKVTCSVHSEEAVPL